MKLARFSYNGKIGYGMVDGATIHPVTGDIFAKPVADGHPVEISRARLLVPTVPTKVIALGLNYRTHAQEVNIPIPKEPMFFYKPPSALIGPGDYIRYPPQSHQVDYEAEMAFVIKKAAKNISTSQALDYVLGYTCFNDVTARDIQMKDGGLELVKSKSFDTFAAAGPWVETDLDPGNLTIECQVNGVVKQAGNTSDLIFDVAEILSYLSRFMTLYPGDIIATGTPSGIGSLSVGDVVAVIVGSLGTLQNTVVQEKSSQWTEGGLNVANVAG